MRSYADRAANGASFWAMAVLLTAATLLGGASQGEQWMRLALNAIAAGLIAWRLTGFGFATLNRGTWILLAGVLAFASVLIFQLVPLPPEIWTHLAGRAAIADGFTLLGMRLPWMPVSLSPEQTFLALLDFLPPIAAIIFGGSTFSSRRSTSLIWLLSGIAAASAALGAAQVLSGGESSPLYFHEISNRGLPSGFFANVNHQAIFLLVCAPFLLVLIARTARASGDDPQRRAALAPIGLLILLVGFGVAMAGSVAGWILSSIVLIFGLTLMTRTTPVWARLLIPLAAVSSATALVMLVLASPVLANKGIGLAENSTSLSSRLAAVQATLPIVGEYFPVGAGFGSFRSVFAAHEDPATVKYNFMNQAHNDWLEVPLEAGAGGIFIVAMALAFLLFSSLRAWIAPGRDNTMGRAASVGLIVLALHSLVDYPLRTSLLATAAALLAAILINSTTAHGEKRSRSPAQPPAHRQKQI